MYCPPRCSHNVRICKASRFFSLPTLLRTENPICTSSSFMVRIPRLSDVCTSPGIASLIFCTPFGSSTSASIIASPLARFITCATASVHSFIFNVTSGSLTWYSWLIVACSVCTACFTVSFASASTTNTACAARGIALSFLPPSINTSRMSAAVCIAFNVLPSVLFALARCLMISMPECPPSSPSTLSCIQTGCIRLHASHTIGIWQTAVIPPAQPTRSCPSSSESRFSIYDACRSSVVIPAAPSMPISSSTVITTSSAGCGISEASKMASANATAIPSSPPRVVRSAWITFPSSTRSNPCVWKSISLSSVFSQTISICPCNITTGASS